MNCVIPGQNLRILGKAIHALAKIGDDIYMEANEECLLLKTMNMAATVFAVAKFQNTFFTHYKVNASESERPTESQTGICCKVPSRSLVGTFKNPNQLEKQVDVCKIELDDSPTRIIFKFRCKYDVNKTHTLWLLDGDSFLQVDSLAADSTHKLGASSLLYAQTLANFQLADTELCLDISPQQIVMRNYVDGEPQLKNHMRSKLSLNPSEFASYEISQAQNIVLTFPLRPFRAAVQFAEHFNLGVTLLFQKAGKPMNVEISNNTTFQLNFVLSTMNADGSTQSTIASEPVLKPVKTINNIIPETNIQNEKRKESMIDSETENELMIPGSPELPQRKRIRHIFQRCFEPTFSNSLLSDDNILANSSDPE